MTAPSLESKGFLFALIAALLYSIIVTFVKLASGINSATLVFFRNLICLIMLLPVLLKTKVSLKTSRPWLLLQRSLVGLLALYLSFTAAKKLPLVHATLLINTAPLFIPLVVGVWLKQRVPYQRALVLLLGFFGVFCILKPQGDLFQIGGILALGAGLCIATALVTIQQLTKTEPLERIMIYFFLSSILFSFPPMVINWNPIPTYRDWLILLSIGIFSFFYQYAITKAHQLAPATKVSSIAYLTVAFSGMWDWLLWKHLPDVWSLFGVILICGGGILSLLDKRPIRLLKSTQA